MSESIGDLSFTYRAKRDQFLQDLAEMDRVQAQYRQKWEKPVAFAGAGAGGGGRMSGSNAADSATGTLGRGPSIQGTSNGDVTWNLANSQNRHQQQQQQATYGTNAARWTMPNVGTPAGAGGGGGGGSGNYNFMQQIFNVNQNQPNQPNPSPQQPKNWWQSNIAIRSLVRLTVAGIVTDAITGMGAAETTYGNTMNLAGGNSRAQAEATLKLRGDIFRSVPVVGGILGNIEDMRQSPIRRELDTSQAQDDFQDLRYGQRSGAYQARARGRAMDLGSGSISGTLARMDIQKQDLRNKQMKDDASALSAFDRANPEIDALPENSAYNGTYDPAYRASVNTAIKNRASSRAAVTGQLHDELGMQIGEIDSGEREYGRQASYSLAMQGAETQRQMGVNNFRPVGAQAQYILDAALNKNRLNRGDSPADVASRMGTLVGAAADIQGLMVPAQENLRYGRGQAYNPYLTSVASFTDRSTETDDVKQSEILKVLEKIAAALTGQSQEN